MRRAVLLSTLLLVGCSVKTFTSSAPDLAGQIASHRFWKVTVTPADVEGWVKTIQELKRDAFVTIDEQAKMKIETGGDAYGTRAIYESINPGKVVLFDMQKYATAPERDIILADLKKEIDKADFRPARKDN
jgi:hypothetical protein